MKSIKKMDFENSKSAAQFPFPQHQNTFLVSNAIPLIDFSLKMLATGRVELTIRISDVTQPLNFPVFNWVRSLLFTLVVPFNLNSCYLHFLSISFDRVFLWLKDIPRPIFLLPHLQSGLKPNGTLENTIF